MTREIATAGILIALAGVLTLFRYGMPFRVKTGGMDIVGTNPQPHLIKLERRYTVLGYIGISLVIFGTGLQVAAIWTPV